MNITYTRCAGYSPRLSNSNNARILKKGIKALIYSKYIIRVFTICPLTYRRYQFRISMDGFNDPRKGNNWTYRQTINIENPTRYVYSMVVINLKSRPSPSPFFDPLQRGRSSRENNRKSCRDPRIIFQQSHLISAESRTERDRNRVRRGGKIRTIVKTIVNTGQNVYQFFPHIWGRWSLAELVVKARHLIGRKL